MGVEVLMVGALGWPTPTEDMAFWRPVLGELSMAAERDGAVRPEQPNTNLLDILPYWIEPLLTLLLHQLNMRRICFGENKACPLTTSEMKSDGKRIL